MSDNDKFAAQMDSDFLGEAQDTLSTIEILTGNIRSGIVPGEEGIARSSAPRFQPGDGVDAVGPVRSRGWKSLPDAARTHTSLRTRTAYQWAW